jgi:polyribonucleotide nucleotidyltransferase
MTKAIVKCGVKVFAQEKGRPHKSPIERSTDKQARELEAKLEDERAREVTARNNKYTVRGTVVSTVNRNDGTATDFIRIPGRPTLVKRDRKRSS